VTGGALCFDGDRWAREEADSIERRTELGQGFADEWMTMRTRLAGSSMMDTAAFTRELESIYRRVAA
jgi:hypothetical protein